MVKKDMNIKDKNLHRIVSTALIYKPDFTYLITKHAIHKKYQMKATAFI